MIDWRCFAEVRTGCGAHNLLDARSALLRVNSSLRLLQTIQWISRYLWFLPSHPTASLAFDSVLAELAALRRRTELVPAARGFGNLAFCLRSLLDGLFERLSRGEPSSPVAVREDHDLAPTIATALLSDDDGGVQLVDAKLVQLCCPALDRSRQALVVRAPKLASDRALCPRLGNESVLVPALT